MLDNESRSSFEYISRPSVINYNSIIVIDSRDEIRRYERWKYLARKYTLSVLTLICTVVENRGGEGGRGWGMAARNPLFRRRKFDFSIFIKSGFRIVITRNLPMQFPDENRLSTAAKLDRQICCFTRFTHASHPPCVHPCDM